MMLKKIFFCCTFYYVAALSAQNPVWIDQCNCGNPVFMRVDEADNVYICTASDPLLLTKISPTGQRLWQKAMYYDGVGLLPTNALMDTAGHFMVIGGRSGINGVPRLFIAKVDLLTGDVYDYTVDSTYYPEFMMTGDPDAYFIHVKLFKGLEHEYYMMTATDLEFTYYPKILIKRFDANLEQTGEHIETIGIYPPTTGLVAPDGASYFPRIVNGTGNVIAKLNPDLSTTAWELPMGYLQTIMAMQYTPDGSLYLLINERQENNIYRTLITRIKDMGTSGEVVWTVQAPQLDGELTMLHYDSIYNRMYAAGSYILGEEINLEQRYAGTVCLDADSGDMLWSHTSEAGTIGFNHIKTDPSGRLFVSGGISYESGNFPTDYWVGYFEFNDNLTTFKTYDGNCVGQVDVAAAIAFNSNNQVVVYGSACESDFTGNWTTTLLYEGLEPIVASPAPQRPAMVSIKPNPVSDVLQITYSAAAKLSYRLDDLTGHTRVQGTLSNPGTEINVANWPAGLYFLSTGHAGSGWTTQKVIVQH